MSGEFVALKKVSFMSHDPLRFNIFYIRGYRTTIQLYYFANRKNVRVGVR